MEPDEPFRSLFSRKKSRYNLIDFSDLFPVFIHGSVDPLKVQREIFMRHEHFAEAQEDSHDRNINLGCLFAV